MESSRRLAAIMFTDIVGYTALMAENERLGKEKSQKYRNTLEKQTGLFGGEIVQHIGDGSLSIFKSAVEAVKCAIAVQKKLIEIDVPLRIGIHLGDIVIHDNDIYGNGVNIASRVESFAQKGTILISERVYREIANHDEFTVISLGLISFKNVKSPMEVFALTNDPLTVPNLRELKGKGLWQKVENRNLKRFLSPKYYFTIVLVILGVGYLSTVQKSISKKSWVFSSAIPAIDSLVDRLSFFSRKTGIGPEAWEAYHLARKVDSIVPDLPALNTIREAFTQTISIRTDPDGATVFIKPYSTRDTSWTELGMTPIDNQKIPSGLLYFKLVKDGFESVQDVRIVWGPMVTNYELKNIGEIPSDMIYVKSSSPDINHFLVDKYEVTNKDYQKFIEAGGYEREEYWHHPITIDQRQVTWEEAMETFTDKTGLRGPATWTGGSFPSGQENHPVSGVSWFEAAAYADFVGRELPSARHFYYLMPREALDEILNKSNLHSHGTVEVGSRNANTFWGVDDLFGNVREWIYNVNQNGMRFAFGGGWSDEQYAAHFVDYALPPESRMASLGFRCIKLLNEAQDTSKLFEEMSTMTWRDFTKEEPKSDDIFQVYLDQFRYPRLDLKPREIYTEKGEKWIKQKIEIDATYGGETIIIYIFLPVAGSPPFQALTYLPTIGAQNTPSSDNSLEFRATDFLIRSGRAVIYPIYKGNYERRSNRTCPDWLICEKEQRINLVKDLRRTIDYLVSREDIDTSKIGLMGMSYGATIGGLVLAVEKRLKLGVLMLGGFWNYQIFPEVDPLYYHPRVDVPILFLTGLYDPYFPYLDSQKPFFKLLGTPEINKKWKTYEDGHNLPREEMIKETFSFLEAYFGKALYYDD